MVSNFEVMNVSNTKDCKEIRLKALKALFEMYSLENDNTYATMMLPRLKDEINRYDKHRSNLITK